MQEINVRDVSFAYPDEPEKLVLSHIDLDVEPGDFICLLGQSGCGKSTFLRLLAGLDLPTSGEILVNGKVIKGASLERSVVFQDYGLFPWMTAGENIILALGKKYPQKNKKQLKEIALDMLQQVGLKKEVYNALPKELSGGMKQRCAIARSFSVDPPILLMDEPFGALDAVTRARLQDMVLTLWAKEEPKKTVFFVTHDVDEALLLANKICVFGQSPSKIIFEYRIPEGTRTTRENMYEDENVLKLRNKLIKYIYRDVTEHV